jgi:hypothetical protein
MAIKQITSLVKPFARIMMNRMAKWYEFADRPTDAIVYAAELTGRAGDHGIGACLLDGGNSAATWE